MTLEGSGTGAGTRDVAGRPNVTRVFLGQRAGATTTTASEGTPATLIEANVDDLDPRLWPGVLGALIAPARRTPGSSPILMKKGRPAHTLHVLCAPDAAPRLRDVVYAQHVHDRRPAGGDDQVHAAADVGGRAGRRSPVPVKISHAGGVIIAGHTRVRRSGRGWPGRPAGPSSTCSPRRRPRLPQPISSRAPRSRRADTGVMEPDRLDEGGVRLGRGRTWLVAVLVLVVVVGLVVLRLDRSGSGTSPAPVPTPVVTPPATQEESHDWPSNLPAGTLVVASEGWVRTVDARSGRLTKTRVEAEPRAAATTPLGDGVLVWHRGGRRRPVVLDGDVAEPARGRLGTATTFLPAPAARSGLLARRVGRRRGGSGSTPTVAGRRRSRSRGRRWPTARAGCSASAGAAYARPTRPATSSGRPSTWSPPDRPAG